VAGIIVLVLSIAALDALNPSTVLPAIVFALGPSARRRLLAFTTGVFVVSTLGGIVLLFAVGRPVLRHLAHPSAHTRHVVELVLGVALVLVGTILWLLRARLAGRLERGRPGRGSALALGAGIMGIELPTAFPYFAAILATVETERGAAVEAALVLAYNVVFVAPLLALLAFAGMTNRGPLVRTSAFIRRWAPVLLPVGVACVGAVLAAVGATGL
jgi:cytochrome c biogenesis protein CcdA